MASQYRDPYSQLGGSPVAQSTSSFQPTQPKLNLGYNGVIDNGKTQGQNLSGANTQQGVGGNVTDVGVTPGAPLAGGQPQQAPSQGNPWDMDQTQQGAGEQYAGAALGYYGANGIPGYSTQAFQDFQGSTPANMNPFYDNAVNQTNNTLNQQLAARGMYGSSAGVGQIANADTNLRAQQSKDEASYGLQRAGLEGQLGSSADQNQLSWTTGLGNLANQSQQLGMERGQNVFKDQMAMSGALSGMEGNAYDQMFGADQMNLDNTMGALGANAANQTATAQGNYNASQNQQNADAKARDDAAMKAAMLAMAAL